MNFEQAKDQCKTAEDFLHLILCVNPHGFHDEDSYKEQMSEGYGDQIKEAMELYADSVARDKDELIKELWQLWESMAECGELSIGPKFSKEYKQLKTRIPA